MFEISFSLSRFRLQFGGLAAQKWLWHHHDVSGITNGSGAIGRSGNPASRELEFMTTTDNNWHWCNIIPMPLINSRKKIKSLWSQNSTRKSFLTNHISTTLCNIFLPPDFNLQVLLCWIFLFWLCIVLANGFAQTLGQAIFWTFFWLWKIVDLPEILGFWRFFLELCLIFEFWTILAWF